MKKIYINIVMLLLCSTVKAQVDRSKMPEPGPAPKIELGETQSFTLENGLKVFVVENHKLPKVSFSLQFDIDPILEGDKAGASQIAGDLMSKGTTNRTKEELNFEVDFMGARFFTSAGSIFGSTLKKHQEKLLDIMSDVIKNSDFKEEELEKLKTQYISAKQTEKDDPDNIAGNVQSVLLFGKDHPYGERTTEETLKNIQLVDVKASYNTYIKPNVAYLAVVGDIDVKEAKALITKYFGDWKSGEVPTHKYEMPVAPKTMQVVLVNKPGAVQSVISAVNIIDLKPGSEDAIKANITNGILGGGFVSKLNLNLREANSYTYGARSSIGSDELVGVFTASAKVRNEVTDSALFEMLKEIDNMRNGNITADELETTKRYRAGTFAIGLENAQTKARFAINVEKYGLDKDYYTNYLKNVEAVNLEDVKAISLKFINPANGYIVIVGNKDEILDKVKAFAPASIVILMDNNGDLATENTLKLAPTGIDAKAVINKYIDAVGGSNNWSKLKGMKTEMSTSTQGMPLTITIISAIPNKSATEIAVNGNVMQKIVFDGEKGALIQGGQAQEFDDERNEKMAVETAMFPEADYLKGEYNLELKGVDIQNDEEVYVVKIMTPGGKIMTNFYSVESGFLILSQETTDAGISEVLYSDYKSVKNVVIPHKILRNAGPQKMELKVEKIVLNPKVEENTFTF
ncbi:insulinase family protein [Vicingaceae bacterium]|nr:insulinase family protein [Vicingaceae bacterium]